MKLLIIQNEIKAPKGQFNSFGKYKYRSCEDILEAVKPVLFKHGFSIILTDDLIEMAGRFYVKATVTISDGSEKYSANGYAREEETKKGMDASQITGAASSYARKYALNGLFAIDDTKDADATNNHEDEKPVNANKLPQISDVQFKKLVDRINAGEKDAADKAKKAFGFTSDQWKIITKS